MGSRECGATCSWPRALSSSFGENYIRVAWEKDGTGVFFVTDLSRDEDSYWLGTELPGEEGLFIVKNLSEKVLYNKGVKYEILQGSFARLQLKYGQWKNLQTTRRRIGNPAGQTRN